MNRAASLSPVTVLSTRLLVASITLLAALTLMSATASVQASQRFAASLTGVQETPPNASTGTAYGSVVLSDDQTTITVNLGFTGLGTIATDAHIHTAPVGVPGGITFPLAGTPAATSGVFSQQTFAISPAQVTDLLAGNMYFNVHSAGFGGGEIRGQIGPATCATAGPIEVEATAGTMGPTAYASLNAAFTAINAGTHQGAINAEVCGNTTETLSAILNSGAVLPAVYTSVNVYPVGGARTITGSIVGAIIKLNGADNVTIDGRIGGVGTTRDLTVTNSNTSTATAAIWLASVAAGNGASNDVIRNLELACGATQNTGANSTFGIYMGGTTIAVAAADGNDNDNNSFIANRIIRARYGIVTGGLVANLNINPVVTDNIIGPAAFGADEIGKVGIFMQSDVGANVSRNTVQFVGGDFANTTSGADRVGIALGVESWSSTPGTLTSSGYNVTRNIVHDVIEERTFSAVGILLGTTNGVNPTNNLVANNFVYNLKANGTAGDTGVGIGIAGGIGDRVVFNSVRMSGDMDPNAGASAPNQTNVNLRIANTPTNLTVKNNSLYIDVFSSSTPALLSANIQVQTATFAFGTGGLNNNNYFFPAANTTARTGAIGTSSLATTFFATLANWQAAITPAQDAVSIQADPQYLSATDLHIALASPNVNVGATGTGVTTDIDAQLRDAMPDIGADEPNGVTPPANDIAATAIITPATGSLFTTGTVVSPQASFTNVGSATQTSVSVQFTMTGPGGYNYSNTQAIASIAPEQTVIVTFAAAPAFSTTGAYVTSAAVTTPDSNAGNDTAGGGFTVANPFNGTYTVGSGGNFPSLTNPGGIFENINSLGATGNIVINIISDLAGENGGVALNEVAGGFTVTIKPTGVARSITGGSTVGIIRLNGADGVTIDGSLAGGTATGVGGTPALRNLTVQNTNAGATAGCVISVLQGPTNSANNNTIKNVNVSGQDPLQTLIGIDIGGNAIGTTPTVNNNNVVVDNCSFQKSFIAIFDDGVSTASQATGSAITHNDMSATGANRLRRAGIFFFNQNGIQVTDNNIGGIVGDESADAIGIIAGIQNVTTTAVVNGGISNALISRNKINGIAAASTVGFSAVGIAIAGDPAGSNVISNNMITGVTAPSTAPDIAAGIFVAGVVSSNTKLYHNSVSMTGDRGAVVAGQIGSYGVAISGTNPTVELKNNIFYTTQTSGGGANAKSYAIGMQSTTFTNLNSNFNDFFLSGANAAGFRTGSLDATGTDFATLALWTGATTQDAGSFSVDPLFVDPLTDLHLNGLTTPLLGNGIAGFATVDYDNDPRPALNPDIGADEIVQSQAGSIPAGTYYNASGGTGDSLGGNVTVTNTLYLTGKLSTGTNTLTIGCNGFVSGQGPTNYIIGNLDRTFCGTGGKAFDVGTANGYSPVQVNATAGTFPADFTVKAVQGPQPNVNPSFSIKRYWTLTNAGLATANLTFQYLAGDVMGTEANYKLIRVSGGTPVSFPASVVTPATHVATLAGVSGFSDWTVGEPVVPTAAPSTISGLVTTADGQPLGGVSVNLSDNQAARTITNSQGQYRFSNVETDGFYTVTPGLANYSFSPSSRSFSLVGNRTDAGFTATANSTQTENPVNVGDFFVRQQYLDFLGREPDAQGWLFWTEQLSRCGLDTNCVRQKRIDISAAFFMSDEFQQGGNYVYRLYRAALGRRLTYAEFSADRQEVIGGPGLEASRTAFADSFVERSEFMQKYQNIASAEVFVDALLQTVQQDAGLELSSQREALIQTYNSGADMNHSRSAVLRAVAESGAFKDAVYNASFVLTEYFGYLQRSPDAPGYAFWLNVLNESGRNGAPGDYRGMVCSFLTSSEYQRRFSPVVVHSNNECGQ